MQVGIVPSMSINEASAVPGSAAERRGQPERRARFWWSILYGSFNPRRRRPSRRDSDGSFQSMDWHDSHLLAVSIGILLLSVADAFMTITLLAAGAVEVNPVMAAVVHQSAAVFAAVKLGMTGVGVTLLVMLARHRFMRVIRVDVAMYCLLVGYLMLLTYEYWMLRQQPGVFDF
jgi:hypothetical protein